MRMRMRSRGVDVADQDTPLRSQLSPQSSLNVQQTDEHANGPNCFPQDNIPSNATPHRMRVGPVDRPKSPPLSSSSHPKQGRPAGGPSPYAVLSSLDTETEAQINSRSRTSSRFSNQSPCGPASSHSLARNHATCPTPGSHTPTVALLSSTVDWAMEISRPHRESAEMPPRAHVGVLAREVMRAPKYGGHSKRDQLGSINESWGEIPNDPPRIGLFQPPPDLLDRPPTP